MNTPNNSGNFRNLLSSEDIKPFTIKSDLKAGLMLINTWALIALALIGGIIGTSIFAVRAAEQARIAEQRSEELQQVADFQSEQLAGVDVPAMGWSLRGKMLEELELERRALSEGGSQ